MMVMDAKAAPNQGGGGVKKKRRKRGGGAGTSPAANHAKDFNGGSGPAPTAGRGGGKGGGGGKKGGGGRRGGGGRGGGESSRLGRNASSPLQLPHVKVTLRNVGGADGHDSVGGVADSVRSFLEGTFPSIADAADVEAAPFMAAWQAEKEDFEAAKEVFAGAASGGGSRGGASPSGSGRAFSSGWVYEEKPAALPSDRSVLLPGVESIVANLVNNKTDKRVSKSSNVNYIVDSAMSLMMQECGKKYLNFVGGRIVFDEESAVDVALAEKVQAEKKILAVEKKNEIVLEEVDGFPGQPSNANENGGADDKKVDTTVEKVTKAIEKLSTSDKPPSKQKILNEMPMIRVRILSVTAVKTSKRRGEIAGKVQLALYPPDPCLLFKEICRDAGKMAAEKHLEEKAKAESESAGGGNAGNEDGPGKDVASPDSKDAESKLTPPTNKVAVPQIPNFPPLSPAERSRAVARSRVLLHRSIEAMKLHAASQLCSWEVLESSSQKTWKGRPNPMVGALMAGTLLRDLVVEHEGVKSASGGGAAARKGRGRGFHGDMRADRYDSTIENSEDYKAFLESLKGGTAQPKESDAKDKKSGDSKHAENDRAPPAVDEEGRPLSAIVMFMRERQAEATKAKAEAAVAQAKARAAAATAKEKVRKEKLKMKKEATKKRKKEAARSKKSGRAAPSSSRPAGGVSGKATPMPPPGAMLLKKGSVSAIPPSGFGVP